MRTLGRLKLTLVVNTFSSYYCYCYYYYYYYHFSEETSFPAIFPKCNHLRFMHSDRRAAVACIFKVSPYAYFWQLFHYNIFLSFWFLVLFAPAAMILASLFSNTTLYHLLPPERKYSNLRSRGHPYELPEYICTNLHKKSFIIQSLYLYI